MRLSLSKKLLKYFLGQGGIDFSAQDLEDLANHTDSLAKHSQRNLLALVYKNNQALIDLFMNSAKHIRDVDKPSDPLLANLDAANQQLYHQLFPILDILMHCEGQTLEGNDDEPARSMTLQFIELLQTSEKPLQDLMKYINKHANKGSPQAIFELCDLKLSLDKKLLHSKHWWDTLMHAGPVIKIYFPYLQKIEELCQQKNLPLPKSKKDLLLYATMACYSRFDEDRDFAIECFKKQIPEDIFDEALNIFKQSGKASDKLPNISIEGAELPQKANRYYLRKLACDDKRGFILGKYTDCCQHLAHEAGKDAAIHGMTSSHGGFYVIMKRSSKSSREEIVAQSWAWLSQSGDLVFDSWEFLRDLDKHLLVPFLDAFSQKTREHGIKGIFVGISGGTPKDLPYEKTDEVAIPVEPIGFSDAKISQWVVLPSIPAQQQSLKPSNS